VEYVIHIEAWFKEILARWGIFDPNDPESLSVYLEDPKKYEVHVGGAVYAFDGEKWNEIWGGTLYQGPLDQKVQTFLEWVPEERWYEVTPSGKSKERPRTWQINLEGHSPFGGGDWEIFHLTSDQWREWADQYEDPIAVDSYIKGEIQFQIRETGRDYGDAPEPEVRQPDLLERVEILHSELSRTRAPPGYASYLSRVYREFRTFLSDIRKVQQKESKTPEDVQILQRFVDSRESLSILSKDISKAAVEALDSSQFPQVPVPHGLYEYILTGAYPETGPEGRPREEVEDGFIHGPHGP